MNLRELLKTGPFFLDGGMGTLLQASGLKPGEAPEQWGLTHRETITGIHRDYYLAGSDMVLTNTFGVHPLRYGIAECEEMIRTAIACADRARRDIGDGKERFVALDIGPCGQLLRPLGNLPFEEAVQGFAELVRLGVKYGADCIFIETMNYSWP